MATHMKASETRLTIYILEPNTCKYSSKKSTRKSGCVATDHVRSLGMRFLNYLLVLPPYTSIFPRKKGGSLAVQSGMSAHETY